jgi:hypothetical protein
MSNLQVWLPVIFWLVVGVIAIAGLVRLACFWVEK